MSAAASVERAARQRRQPRTFPVVEVFGATIQGEGPAAGRVCSFVRFGGCDYRCSWCDSMHAVDPALVRQAERLTADEILARVPEAPLVILSGGNPALHELGDVVRALQGRYIDVHVETQGSVWRPWLGTVDTLVVSPKPPSSGMATPKHRGQLRRFLALARTALPTRDLALKIVVFDERDYVWALDFAASEARPLPLYLSVGTPPLDTTGDACVTAWEHGTGEPLASDRDVRESISDRYRWLCERVASDPRAHGATVLPQLHVIAWGTKQGV